MIEPHSAQEGASACVWKLTFVPPRFKLMPPPFSAFPFPFECPFAWPLACPFDAITLSSPPG